MFIILRLKEVIFGESETVTICPKIEVLWGGGGRSNVRIQIELYQIFKVLMNVKGQTIGIQLIPIQNVVQLI